MCLVGERAGEGFALDRRVGGVLCRVGLCGLRLRGMVGVVDSRVLHRPHRRHPAQGQLEVESVVMANASHCTFASGRRYIGYERELGAKLVRVR